MEVNALQRSPLTTQLCKNSFVYNLIKTLTVHSCVSVFYVCLFICLLVCVIVIVSDTKKDNNNVASKMK